MIRAAAADAADVSIFALCGCFDLEFGEVCEDFTHGRSRQSKVLNNLLLEQLGALVEQFWEFQVDDIASSILTLLIDSKDLG